MKKQKSSISVLEPTSTERGQVLPLWSAAVVICFALSFMVLNYGNQIRWQIRAQNAADSAAAAAIGIQSERFNLVLMMMYASGVEEYRSRRLLDGLLLSTFQSGGCTVDPTNLGSVNFGTCGYVYAKLRPPFIRSALRYNADLAQLSEFNLDSSFANWTDDATTLVTNTLRVNCNQSNLQPFHSEASLPNDRVAQASPPDIRDGEIHVHLMAAGPPAPKQPVYGYNVPGGDCGFYLSIAPNGIGPRTGILASSEDAEGIVVPDLGRTAQINNDTQGLLWTPGEIDVVACSVVPPIVPNFGPFHFAPVYAVGRGAATTALMEQDWLQPGALVDPIRTGPNANLNLFQPVEDYVDNVPNHDFVAGCPSVNGTTCMQSTQTPAYYNVDFGGTSFYANPQQNYFTGPITGPEMDVRTGWWGALPIKPFGNSPVLNAQTCHP